MATDWTPPETARIFDAIDATWAPQSVMEAGDWHVRAGDGGGNRVSAASFRGGAQEEADFAPAEAAHDRLGQPHLFIIRPGEQVLDRRLDARGYRVFAPVRILGAAATKTGAGSALGRDAIPCARPFALIRALWAEGGIGPGRLAVMGRVKGPKTFLLARHGQDPAGVAFVAVHDGICMLHALEIAPGLRRRGLGALLTRAASDWGARNGASDFLLLVTRENAAANGLYEGLGMTRCADYHYRRKIV